MNPFLPSLTFTKAIASSYPISSFSSTWDVCLDSFPLLIASLLGTFIYYFSFSLYWGYQTHLQLPAPDCPVLASYGLLNSSVLVSTGPSHGARPELNSLSHPSNLLLLLVHDIPSYPVCHSGNFQIFVLFLLITTQVPSAVISWPTPIKLHFSVLACLSDTAAPKNSWMECHHIGQWKHRICVIRKIHYEHSVGWRGPSKRVNLWGSWNWAHMTAWGEKIALKLPCSGTENTQ